MTLPALSISSTGIEIDDTAYVEVQMTLRGCDARTKDWGQIMQRIVDIGLEHTGDVVRPETTPGYRIEDSRFGQVKRSACAHFVAYKGQFDKNRIEPFRAAVGRMLDEEFGIDQVHINVRRY
ncbi:MAG: hypothetical protein ABIR91_05860 [Candidatus Saccharimonadales bacterium]